MSVQNPAPLNPTTTSRRIILLGTGTIIPHRERGQSSFLLDSEGEFFLFDCGSGTETRLAQAGVDPCAIDHIFLSHHHIDHDAGVMPLLKGMRLSGKQEVTLYGPEGTARWYEDLQEVWPYMKEREGRLKVKVVEMAPGDTISVSHLEVSCQEMVHSVPALGYRVMFPDGASLVYSGDTEPCPGLETLLENRTTVLVQECALPETLEVTNHTTPQTLADFLGSIRAGSDTWIDTIILTHFYMENLGREDAIREIIKKERPDTGLICGRDLLEFTF